MFVLISKYTCDRTRENDSHVLLMHKRDLDREKLSLMKRNPEQIWLLWQDEPNENSPYINKFKFNWTISYRMNAEASIGAYGITIVKKKPWSIEQFNSWIDEQLDKRFNQAVWYVIYLNNSQKILEIQVSQSNKCITAVM